MLKLSSEQKTVIVTIGIAVLTVVGAYGWQFSSTNLLKEGIVTDDFCRYVYDEIESGKPVDLNFRQLWLNCNKHYLAQIEGIPIKKFNYDKDDSNNEIKFLSGKFEKLIKQKDNKEELDDSKMSKEILKGTLNRIFEIK